MHDATLIRERLEAAGASFLPFGDGPEAPELVERFDGWEPEYAAIRKGVGLFHAAQRGILRLTGADRADYLHRMLTQTIDGMVAGTSIRSFVLSEKGRIIADVIVHHGDADTWLELDRVDAGPLAGWLENRLFAEDVAIEDFSGERVVLELHGPEAAGLLAAVAADPERAREAAAAPGTHHVLELAGAGASVSRRDRCGVPGLTVMAVAEGAAGLHAALAEAGGGLIPAVEADAAGGGAKRAIRGRGIGWLAFNTARIEAGTPLYHVDFGPDALPGETGLLEAAVSFTKGCYIGQEVVARMQNLGHPKRLLVGLDLPDERLPIAGTPLTDEPGGNPVGLVTSSTLSPLLGGRAIALGQVKWAHRQPGATLYVAAEGEEVAASVRERPGVLEEGQGG